MANLDQELQKFKTSVMGEEIRNALVSSVTLMNNDLSHIVALGGIPGEKGDPFTYADFTMQQLEALKGDQGDKGEPFKYSDFTPIQLADLKGPKGDEGIQGNEGPQGTKGDPFTYADFTPEQLALLKGAQGEQGEPFKYSDFTPEQLELLKGEKGDAFTYADFTQAQLNGLVGEKGEPFTYEDFTPEQLELLRGPKGESGEGTGDMLASVYDKNNSGTVDNAEKVNGFTVAKNVPSDAKFTDTIYEHPTSHPASMITESVDKQFISDVQKTAWNNKWDYNETTIKNVKVNNATDADTVTGKTVGTNVPVDAIFTDTDTVTRINSKTGDITKQDIVDLGIPAQDTTYDFASKADKTQVLTDVPVGAVFTDTITTINGKTGTIKKSDITALGIPAQDTIVDISGKVDKITDKGLSANDFTNTYRDKLVGLENYTHPATHPYSMITGGPTSLPASDVSAWAKAGTKPSYTKAEVGLTNVDNVKQMPISGGVLENYREKLVALSGISTTINLSLGNVFTHTLSGNTTYTISNAVNGQAHSFTLIINMGSTVRTLTFPASVKWQGGEIPDMTTASKTYVLTFMTVNGGTNWLGMFGGEF